jgi:CrcB protein
MRIYLWIGLGSALGGMLRYGLSEWVTTHAGRSFPFGTLLINVSGSFLIGLFAAWAQPSTGWWGSEHGRAFLMAGICGGYTTFSAFSLQTLDLVRDGQLPAAGWNILLSVALCLAAVWLGFRTVEVFSR